MGIKEYLFRDTEGKKPKRIISFDPVPSVINVKMDGVIFGFLVKEDDKWLWSQIGSYYLSSNVLKVIGEKIEELNMGSRNTY